jgi:hypothetical protein
MSTDSEPREARVIRLIKLALETARSRSRLGSLLHESCIAELEAMGVGEAEAITLCPWLLSPKERLQNERRMT